MNQKYLGWGLAGLLAFSCCRPALENNLDPESREFLSKVRFIISPAERRSFLDLPASQRTSFIEDFWRKRDPNPATEENEYKTAYFKRIEEANQLFRDGSGPGWLQDRGRIYILLGPPSNRETYPRGVTFYGQPTEIWYYGFFPIIFIDQSWSGDYRFQVTGADDLALINMTQMSLKPVVLPEEGALDFRVEFKRTDSGETLIQVFIPYNKIWLKPDDQIWRTDLSLSAEIQDSKGAKVWDRQSDFRVELSNDRLAESLGRDYQIEIPVSLPSGSYFLSLALQNQGDHSRQLKKVPFEVDQKKSIDTA